MIDERGNLFGKVNAIDAVVLVVVLVSLGSGLGWVVASDGNATQPNESETLVFTAESLGESLAVSVSSGDRIAVGPGSDTFAVAEVYRTRSPDGGVRLVARVTPVNETGREYRRGQRVSITSEEYALNATVTRTGVDSLALTTANVTIRTTVSQRVATAIDSGDTHTLAGSEIATISDVATIERGDSTATLNLLVRLDTIGDDPKQFAGAPIRLGQSIPFETVDYRLNGTVVSKRGRLRTDRVTRSVTLQTTVSNAVADEISAGDTYRVGDRTVATIDTVRTTPSGSFGRKRVRLHVTLQAVDRGDRTTFLGKPLTVGTEVPFETRRYGLTAPIVALDSQPLDRTAGTTRATVEVSSVSAAVARALEDGMNYTVDGTVFATVEATRVEPATVIVESRDGEIYAREHPELKDVVLTVALRTRQTRDGTMYAMEPLRVGRTVGFDFGIVRVRGTITDIRR